MRKMILAFTMFVTEMFAICFLTSTSYTEDLIPKVIAQGEAPTSTHGCMLQNIPLSFNYE